MLSNPIRYLAAPIIASVLMLPVTVLAYDANVGDRAQDFAGWDIVSQRSVSLESFHGRWLLVDFWASWCGPCLEDIPALLDQTRDLRKSGDLEVLSVACDSSDTLPALRRIIREYGITYPVLYDGLFVDSQPAVQWHIDEWPSTFLVNPEGVIVATGLSGETLSSRLAFFMSSNKIMGLSSFHREHSDGSISIFAEVYSPAHEEVELNLRLAWETYIFDVEDPQRVATDYRDGYAEEPISGTLAFTFFGSSVYEFTIQPTSEMDVIHYAISMTIPGSEDISPQSGGHRISSHQSVALTPGIEVREGITYVRPD